MATALDLNTFFADFPVFTLGQLAEARGEHGRLAPAHNQLKWHVRNGRVKHVVRGVYAVVPPGMDPDRFHPDPFLVANAVRPQGIFAYHSALELLGTAHSVWNRVTLICDQRSRPIDVGSSRIEFLVIPAPMRRGSRKQLGTQQVLRSTRRILTTGPERTLVECLRRPDQAGGLDEVVEAVSGLPLLDFDLLGKVLDAYNERSLWAAVGWLTEREQSTWSTPKSFIEHCYRRRPRQNQYLIRSHRGGKLLPRWRLIIPAHHTRGFEGGTADT